MKAETKFNINDECVIIEKGKLLYLKVHSIKIEIENNNIIKTTYWFFTEPDRICHSRKENEVWKSKDEFINNL